MCVYARAFLEVHVCKNIYMCQYDCHVCAHSCIHSCSHTFIHFSGIDHPTFLSDICFLRAYTHTCTISHDHVCMFSHTYVYIHPHEHEYINVYIHSHEYVCGCRQHKCVHVLVHWSMYAQQCIANVHMGWVSPSTTAYSHTHKHTQTHTFHTHIWHTHTHTFDTHTHTHTLHVHLAFPSRAAIWRGVILHA